ncbi:MAG: Nif3-like dinuclear metal center hexameric protein [Candidatus Nanoarchaeia archaeon]
MTELNEIVEFLNNYLEIDSFRDSSFNGLQFEGTSKVNKILFAVDSGLMAFEKAVEEEADMIVVHHGIFWNGSNPSIRGIMKKRLKILFENNISLYAAHLPLDKHKDSGNNAELAKLIGARITDEFVEIEGTKIGYIGELNDPKMVNELAELLEKSLNTTAKVLENRSKKVSKVGICSGGGGQKAFREAAEKKVDLYITGEQTDIYNDAYDSGINVIFAGHHATETVGVKALAQILENKFNLKTKFVDIPTQL